MDRIGIFLDRDGTINAEVDYLRHPDDLQLIGRAGEAIRTANREGWKVVVATNQSGIARGMFDEQTLDLIHNTLRQRLADHDARLDGIYYCPHHPDDGRPPYRRECDCRKPATGMLRQAAADLGIDLHRSFVIGDRMIDVRTAVNAGATPILVRTGYGATEIERCRAEGIALPAVADDLFDAIQIVKQSVQQLQRS